MSAHIPLPLLPLQFPGEVSIGGTAFLINYLWVRNSFPLLVNDRGLLLSSSEHLRPARHQVRGNSSGESWNREQKEASSSESSINVFLPVPPLEGESGPPASVELVKPVPAAVDVLLVLLTLVVTSRLFDAAPTYLLVREFRWNDRLRLFTLGSNESHVSRDIGSEYSCTLPVVPPWELVFLLTPHWSVAPSTTEQRYRTFVWPSTKVKGHWK